MLLRRSGGDARLVRLRSGRAGRPRARAAAGRAALGLLLALAVVAGCSHAPRGGAVHVLRPGENLYRVGLRYGVSPEAIARANGIRDVTAIPVGTRLRIPGTHARARRAGIPPPPRAGDAVRRPGIAFAWPVRGRVTSGYGHRGGRLHEGIDIAARPGTPIRAAEAGKVIYSGRLGGYGKVVIVKHQGALRSVYAHASRLFVRRGQLVERGQRLGAVGSTGRATGPHLHFEVRRGERPQDPLRYLP